MPWTPYLNFISQHWLKSVDLVTFLHDNKQMLQTSSVRYRVSKDVTGFKPESPSRLQRCCWRKWEGGKRGQGGDFESGVTRQQEFILQQFGKTKGSLWIFALKNAMWKQILPAIQHLGGQLLTWWSGAHRYVWPLGGWLDPDVLIWPSSILAMMVLAIRSPFRIRCISVKMSVQTNRMF